MTEEPPMPAAEPMSQEIVERLRELLAIAQKVDPLPWREAGEHQVDIESGLGQTATFEYSETRRLVLETINALPALLSTLTNLTPSVEGIRAEAFEEAAKVAADIRTGVSGEYGLGFDRAAEDIASAIRALALPSEPPSQGDVEGRARELERECDWPADGFFTFRDEPGEHDPCYVVMPGGAMLPLNHHAGTGVDIARAKFIVSACNAALFSGGLYKAHFATPTVETAALQWFVGFEWEPRSVRESNFAVAGFRAGAEWALASKEDGRS